MSYLKAKAAVRGLLLASAQGWGLQRSLFLVELQGRSLLLGGNHPKKQVLP